MNVMLELGPLAVSRLTPPVAELPSASVLANLAAGAGQTGGTSAGTGR